ncbi:ribonuclease P protein component [Hutsoniella sourekii]|uniref:ribonuclease P protein component n=1 Tax=Hutsoniella sourekii TaxID=87650 RepID=UPI000489C02E|nr:ribonuclease P protein component [Hutsoniella sourekii]
MKKKYRVKSDRDFQRVFHQGESVANRQLVLYVLAKEHQDHFRVGLSVGKKMGNAVQRNQIKRYLRQAIFELEDQIPAEIDFILIARHGIKGMGVDQIKSSICHVMKLAKIL